MLYYPKSVIFVFYIAIILFPILKIFAIPKRGIQPWSIILCKYKELERYEPKTKEWFEMWLAGDQLDSIEMFFTRVSNGVYRISGSSVFGWSTLKYTQKEILKMVSQGESDLETPSIGSEISFAFYEKVKELCIESTAGKGINLHKNLITVINSGRMAVFGKKTGVLISSQLIFPSVLTHEMVHSFYIGHSYSDRKIKVFPFAENGEYDDRYDLMSTSNAYMHNSKFGMDGPGLNGPHLDFLGWLPMNRLVYHGALSCDSFAIARIFYIYLNSNRFLFFGSDGKKSQAVRLSSLSIPHNMTNGWLLIGLPYVELRTPNRFDKGIGRASILIHRVQKIGESYYSILLTQTNGFTDELKENIEWENFLEKKQQSIRLKILKVHDFDVDLMISSSFDPDECQMDEKRLELNNFVLTSSDDNFIGHICVNSTKDNITKEAISKQIERRDFYRETFGANACLRGYLWRSLDPWDYICITKERYNSVRRGSTDFPTPCRKHLIKRDAFPGDQVCVSESEKRLSRLENLNSPHNLRNPAFFNGIDTVEI